MYSDRARGWPYASCDRLNCRRDESGRVEVEETAAGLIGLVIIAVVILVMTNRLVTFN
jgi:hypothetical protein